MNCIYPCNFIDTYVVPYEGDMAQYLIVSESPQSDLVLSPNKSMFWGLMAKHGFTKNQFKIIYSINCKIEGKPSEHHRNLCRHNIKNMLKDFNPEWIIICGNFALHTLTDKWGIKKYEGKHEKKVLFSKQYNVVYWQNPNTMLFSKNTENSIKSFKNLTNNF